MRLNLIPYDDETSSTSEIVESDYEIEIISPVEMPCTPLIYEAKERNLTTLKKCYRINLIRSAMGQTKNSQNRRLFTYSITNSERTTKCVRGRFVMDESTQKRPCSMIQTRDTLVPRKDGFEPDESLEVAVQKIPKAEMSGVRLRQ